MKHRDQLLKKAKKKENADAWKAYKDQRNLTTNEIRNAHEKYIHDIIGDMEAKTPNDNFAGIKRFWRYVKATKKENHGIPTLHSDEGPITTDKSKASTLNKQFKDAFTKERTRDIP